ncbi:hypothetical protein ABZW96_26705 [Nocardia sp. NPDC004168]|uniref:hypothetical protein n=1 Tax=unclassified Nocardia TaxID=2637762 RepID=UPI0033B77634
MSGSVLFFWYFLNRNLNGSATMSETLLGDIKSDRVTLNLLFDSAEFCCAPGEEPAHTVRIGAPTVQDNRMCAQCVGECKVF